MRDRQSQNDNRSRKTPYRTHRQGLRQMGPCCMIADDRFDQSAREGAPMRYPNQLSVIKYQDPATRTYLGSPSILRLDDSSLLVTHDYFGPGCPRNHEDEEHLTSVYRSSDDGRTWTQPHAYCRGVLVQPVRAPRRDLSHRHVGAIRLDRHPPQRRWRQYLDASPRRAHRPHRRGGPYHDPPNYHCAPMPVLLRDGRLYRAFEDLDPGVWPTGFRIAGHFRAGGCRSARCRKLDAQQSACLRSGLDAAGMGR